MKTIEELRNHIVKHYTNVNGDVILIGLDLTSVKGYVDISGMKVSHNLFQNNQEVGGSLFQEKQEVIGSLFQNNQIVGRFLFQDKQDAGSEIKQDDLNTIKYNKELKDLKEKYGIKDEE